MPILTMDVESFTVGTTQSGVSSSGSWRFITMSSPDLSHGIHNRATVYFFESPAMLGIATNIDQPNYNGITAYAYCRKEDFADWYGMLRNEAHLKFSYWYSGPDYDANQPTRNLSWVQLYTGQPEPPGEGAEDLQARIFPAHMLEALQADEGAA